MPAKKQVTTPKKRKVSPAGCKKKGSAAELSLVKALEDRGLPAQRVLSSGANAGAKADVKIGVVLEEDGSYPHKDESRSIMRAEVKHRAVTPEYLFTEMDDVTLLIQEYEKNGTEQIWKDLSQDSVSRVLMLRRAKLPPGTVAQNDYNKMFVAVMGLDDWIDLIKKAYPERFVEEIPPQLKQ